MRRILILHIALLTCALSFAQTKPASGIPYQCGFEQDSVMTHWVLNPSTPTATDKWIVGTATHSEGRRSLYISKDGTSPNYGGNPNVVAAYLRYKFPTQSRTQKYDISFDWKGIGDSVHSRLYVMVCPEAQLTASGSYNLGSIVSAFSGRLSTSALGSCEYIGESGEKYVCGGEQWQNVSLAREVSISANASTQNFAIVFLWVNDNRNDSVRNSSIAIDNLQISSAQLKKPVNLDVIPQCDDSTMLVKWESVLTEFDVEYRKVGDVSWRRISGLNDDVEGFTRNGLECSFIIRRILEGSYDVRVRGRSDDLTTNYIYKNLILVYCPDNHCVNYVDLYGPNVVCTYGMHEKHTGQTPYDNIGVINFGPDSEDSRHTLHVDPNEVDPRTDSLLHTVPPGALASVRLGNWNASGKAQSITYNLTVDTATQGILIMKYAVVLDNSGHGRDEEPYFRIQILDENDNQIDECGQADFAYSDAVAAGDTKGWHLTSYQGSSLAWKEWTAVGVPLMRYHGQNIKVCITSADCGQTVHYGYGYFTLDCANAHIETENCGNDAAISCTAPEGFSYLWYKDNNIDSVVSTDQTLVVDASRAKYTCRVSFIEEPTCYFEISTTSEPRFPVPEYNFERVYGECLSKLRFTNTSHVMNKWAGYEQHTTEPCTDCNWRFRCLSTGETKETSAWSPTYTCPSQGDSIEVTLTSYIGAENSCDSTRVDTIVVPNIIPDSSLVSYITCSESPVKFDGMWYNTDTTVVHTFPNFAGCDSTSTLILKVYPEIKDTYRHDSICSDQSVVINGVSYNQPLDNYLIMLQSVYGCDSAVYLSLTVNQRISAQVDSFPYVCADAGEMYLEFDIAAGEFDSLQIRFSTPGLRDTTIFDSSVRTVVVPYADTITPGHYQATLRFYQFCCGVYEETRNVNIRYRSSIVEQKWNDVLTLLSPKYNGGYEFTAFQWYKDGMPLMGENHSYLYQPLDFSSSYYVELTRPDGVVMATCPIQPVYHEQQTAFPTIVTVGQHVPMYMEREMIITYYTVSGQLYSTFTMPQGYGSLPVPYQTGVYVIKATDAQGETQAQLMLVE